MAGALLSYCSGRSKSGAGLRLLHRTENILALHAHLPEAGLDVVTERLDGADYGATVILIDLGLRENSLEKSVLQGWFYSFVKQATNL